jgi:hypothetical protein
MNKKIDTVKEKVKLGRVVKGSKITYSASDTFGKVMLISTKVAFWAGLGCIVCAVVSDILRDRSNKIKETIINNKKAA